MCLPPEWISVGSGSDEMIRSLCVVTCVGGAGSILVAPPTFSMYAVVAETLGVPAIATPRLEDTFEIDLDGAQVAMVVQEVPVRAVFAVHPNSPTGNLLSEREIDWLRELPEDVLVAIDEAYFEFSGKTLAREIPDRPNWIVLRTFSKAFRLASHRVGYAIGCPEAIAALEKVRLPYNLPAFSQAAALVALEHRAELLAGVDEIVRERDRLFQALQKIPALRVRPGTGNFLFGCMRHQTAFSPATIADRLKGLGTLARVTSGGLRLTVGSPAENDRLIERLHAILE